MSRRAQPDDAERPPAERLDDGGAARNRGPAVLAASAGLLLVAVALSTAVGALAIPLGEVVAVIFGGPEAAIDPRHGAVIWSVRLPRVALGALVGAGLASGGAALQGLFRNPLADPYVLGIASGGGLGAAVVLLLAGQGALDAGLIPAGAFAGAAVATAAVHGLAWRAGRLPLASVLLAGVAVGLIGSAGVSLVLVLAESQAGDIVQWLLGDLGGHGWREVGQAALCVVPALCVLGLHARDLDALLLGEEAAAGLGVEVARAKLWVLGATALAVAGAVAWCGLIGFVGLIVPHAARLLAGGGHRWLLPISAVAGAATLVAADAAARTVLPDRALPVGVVTGCLGGPFFLWLLRRAMR